MQELNNTKILKRELNERALSYTGTQFELKNINIEESKFPLLAYNHIAAITASFYHLVEMLKAAVLIRGRCLLIFSPHARRLIEGGAFSWTAPIEVNSVHSKCKYWSWGG